NDTPGNNFRAVRVLSGLFVSSGNGFVSVSDILAGKMWISNAYPTDKNGPNYAQVVFQVQDDGGTANGGQDWSQIVNTLTINILPVNDPPAGTGQTVGTPQDKPYTFTVADFGFSDPSDVPPNNLLAVKISWLPTPGSLTANGTAVAVGQFIP